MKTKKKILYTTHRQSPAIHKFFLHFQSQSRSPAVATIMESELKKRRETAEKLKEQLVHEAILNGRESDQKHSQYPPELRAIARAWSGLKHWGLEDRLNEDICLYYEYLDDGPCAVRMLAYNTSVKKAVLALRTSGKDGLASRIEDKWKEVQECTFQADDNIPVFRLQMINENIINIDEKGFSKKVRRAVDSARGKASLLGCELELVVKQQIEEFKSKLSATSGNLGMATGTDRGQKPAGAKQEIADLSKTQGQTTENLNMSWQAKAIGCLWEHRDWSIKRIAEEVDKTRQALYDDDDIKAAILARNSQKRAHSKNSRPKGEKNPETGQLEAWE